MCVTPVVGQGIQENIMHEKELLIRCVKNPGYAAARLQSQFGYTMIELQQLRNGESIHKSTKQ
jgi:hypothetical protein